MFFENVYHIFVKIKNQIYNNMGNNIKNIENNYFSANQILVANFLLHESHKKELFEQYKQQDFVGALSDTYFEGISNRAGILKSLKDLLNGKTPSDSRPNAHHNKMAVLVFGINYTNFVEEFETGKIKNTLEENDLKKLQKLIKATLKIPFTPYKNGEDTPKHKKIDKETLKYADVLVGDYLGYNIDHYHYTNTLGEIDEISIYVENEKMKVKWVSVEISNIKSTYYGTLKVLEGRIYIELKNEMNQKHAYIIFYFDAPPVQKKRLQVLNGVSMGCGNNQIVALKHLLIKEEYVRMIDDNKIINFLQSNDAPLFHADIPNSYLLEDFIPRQMQESANIEQQNADYIAENFSGLYYAYGSSIDPNVNPEAKSLFWQCPFEIETNGRSVRVAGAETNYKGSIKKIGNDLKVEMWQANKNFERMIRTENMINITIKTQDVMDFGILCAFANSKSSRSTDFSVNKIILKKLNNDKKKGKIMTFEDIKDEKKIFYTYEEVIEYYEQLPEDKHKDNLTKISKEGFRNIALNYLHNPMSMHFPPRFSHRVLHSPEFINSWEKLQNPKNEIKNNPDENSLPNKSIFLGFRFDLSRNAFVKTILEVGEFQIRYTGIDSSYNLKLEVQLDNIYIFNAEDSFKYRTRFILRHFDNCLKGTMDRIDRDNKLPVARQIIFVPYQEPINAKNENPSLIPELFDFNKPEDMNKVNEIFDIHPEVKKFFDKKGDIHSNHIMPSQDFYNGFYQALSKAKEEKD